MNEIRLGAAALDVARIATDHLKPITNLVQEALDPIAHGNPSDGSLMAKDIKVQQREGNEGRMGLLGSFVLEHTLTRAIAVMDALQGLRVLLAAVTVAEDRTGTAPAIVARSAFDAGTSLSHHLHGTLEDRLLRGYASTLGEMQQSLLADQDQPAIVEAYTSLRARAGEIGYRLQLDNHKKSAGLPRVLSVSQGSRTANCEPNTTDAAKKYGTAPFAEQQWRYTSGITHGRMWAILGIHHQLEAGDETGGVYLTALATAWHGASMAIRGLATYTGHSETAARLDDLNYSLGAALADGGHVPSLLRKDSNHA